MPNIHKLLHRSKEFADIVATYYLAMPSLQIDSFLVVKASHIIEFVAFLLILVINTYKFQQAAELQIIFIDSFLLNQLLAFEHNF